jgi:hypothetical protein
MECCTVQYYSNRIRTGLWFRYAFPQPTLLLFFLLVMGNKSQWSTKETYKVTVYYFDKFDLVNTALCIILLIRRYLKLRKSLFPRETQWFLFPLICILVRLSQQHFLQTNEFIDETSFHFLSPTHYMFRLYVTIIWTKLCGLSPRANYTDHHCQIFRIDGAVWSVWRIPTVVFSVFYNGAATFSFK